MGVALCEIKRERECNKEEEEEEERKTRRKKRKKEYFIHIYMFCEKDCLFSSSSFFNKEGIEGEKIYYVIYKYIYIYLAICMNQFVVARIA